MVEGWQSQTVCPYLVCCVPCTAKKQHQQNYLSESCIAYSTMMNSNKTDMICMHHNFPKGRVKLYLLLYNVIIL
jgi:hypothetical protein